MTYVQVELYMPGEDILVHGDFVNGASHQLNGYNLL